jgi:hypothetical protein
MLGEGEMGQDEEVRRTASCEAVEPSQTDARLVECDANNGHEDAVANDRGVSDPKHLLLRRARVDIRQINVIHNNGRHRNQLGRGRGGHGQEEDDEEESCLLKIAERPGSAPSENESETRAQQRVLYSLQMTP